MDAKPTQHTETTHRYNVSLKLAFLKVVSVHPHYLTITVQTYNHNRVPEGQLLVDLFPNVFSHVVQPGPTPSQDPSDNIHWGHTATAGQMPKDIRSLLIHLSIIQQAQRLHSRESIKQEQYPQGIGRYILGTTEGNTTDDLQGSWEIDHQLCCTCLEYKTYVT